MPNFSGNWKIIRSENFEDLLKVLGKEMVELAGAEVGVRKKGQWGSRHGGWVSASPKKGPFSWVRGALGPGGLDPFSGGAPQRPAAVVTSL